MTIKNQEKPISYLNWPGEVIRKTIYYYQRFLSLIFSLHTVCIFSGTNYCGEPDKN